MIFKYWGINLPAFRESLARKGFAIASAGLLQQGAIVATVEAGPLAYKGSSTLSHDPSRRFLILTVSNSKTPHENLNEILSTLDISGVPSRELIERIEVTGNILLNSPIAPMTIIQKVVSKDAVDRIGRVLGTDVGPIGLRLASKNPPTDIFEKPHFNLLIEPLFTDMTKFIVQVLYNGRAIDEAVDFLSNLFANVISVI